MSSVSGISGSSSSSSIYELLLQASQSSESDDSTTVSGLLGVSSTTTNEGGVDDLRSQIDDAISEALSGLDESSSIDEIKSAIQDAVDSVMESNGIDPSQLPPPPPAEESSTSETSDETSDETSTEASTELDPFMTKLKELLEENGFDSDSIISQLQAEMSADGGAFSSLMNIQSQEGVDTTA